MDYALEDFRKFTKTIMNKTIARNYSNSEYNSKKSQHLEQVYNWSCSL
jgi:hypothetical protein